VLLNKAAPLFLIISFSFQPSSESDLTLTITSKSSTSTSSLRFGISTVPRIGMPSGLEVPVHYDSA
jgi:hypothetical protein